MFLYNPIALTCAIKNTAENKKKIKERFSSKE